MASRPASFVDQPHDLLHTHKHVQRSWATGKGKGTVLCAVDSPRKAEEAELLRAWRQCVATCERERWFDTLCQPSTRVNQTVNSIPIISMAHKVPAGLGQLAGRLALVGLGLKQLRSTG